MAWHDNIPLASDEVADDLTYMNDNFAYLKSNLCAPSTTAMVFYQDSAPNGWSIKTDLTDGSILYYVTGSGAGGTTGGTAKSGGTWTISGMNNVDNHSHLFMPLSGGTTRGFVGRITSLSDWPYESSTSGPDMYLKAFAVLGNAVGDGSAMSTNWLYTQEAGQHSHTFDGSWRPPGYNCIICTKD